jgi:hypothetical protein
MMTPEQEKAVKAYHEADHAASKAQHELDMAQNRFGQTVRDVAALFPIGETDIGTHTVAVEMMGYGSNQYKHAWIYKKENA